MKRFSIICACMFSLMCLNSCEPVTSVPVANVNFTTSIYSNGLVHIGGHEYFTGAIKGLFVYRFDMTTFYAYDRACSYDWKDDGYVTLDTANVFLLICNKCHSTFSILNGYPMGKDIKANAPLRAYNATMIDDINLRIYK